MNGSSTMKKSNKQASPFKLKPLHLIFASVILCLFPFYLLGEETYKKAKNVHHGDHHTLTAPHDLEPHDLEHAPLNNSTTPLTKPPRVRSNRSRLHKPLKGLSKEELRLEELNSVDYYACCGLGHRLTKLTDAWYVSRELNFAMKTFWGFCDEHREVFSYLFGAQPVEEVTNVAPENRMLQLRNEVPGMVPLLRSTERCNCDGHDKKIQRDLQLYQSLFDRFRFKHTVDDFMTANDFGNHTVLGMHIRAGNGETGDFKKKKRGIGNIDKWVNTVVNHLQTFLAAEKIARPLLYIATDTPSMILKFRNALPNITVVDLPQERAESGVLFGEWGAITRSGSQCLGGWVQAVTDMMILSSANVVIAARPSSFVLSMPHALALGREGGKFCELPHDATWFKCYDNYRDWCCTTSTKSVLADMQPFEYIRMPNGPVDVKGLQHKFFARRGKELVLPMHLSTVKNTDLPYSWHKLVAKYRDGSIQQLED